MISIDFSLKQGNISMMCNLIGYVLGAKILVGITYILASNNIDIWPKIGVTCNFVHVELFSIYTANVFVGFVELLYFHVQ